jgi:NAD(P)-dependent dehydrogenase (short-subunit alcohol dehydrogenase family)
MPMTNSLAGRVAVVTGAARGIGDAIAERLLADGASVFSLDKLPATEPRVGVVYLEADVTDPSSVAEAFKSIDAKTDAIDILVNNAGIQRVGLVGKISFAEWSAVVSTHLNGFFLCASEAVPRMVARGKGGAIVSIASTAAFVGLPGRSAYCAAKAGILGLTRALALEVASAGIRVNAVAPGFARTKLIDQGLADGSLQEDWMVARVPMKRLAAPQEIANAVRYLAGDEASYVTGQTIIADGGWTVQGIRTRQPGCRPRRLNDAIGAARSRIWRMARRSDPAPVSLFNRRKQARSRAFFSLGRDKVLDFSGLREKAAQTARQGTGAVTGR